MWADSHSLYIINGKKKEYWGPSENWRPSPNGFNCPAMIDDGPCFSSSLFFSFFRVPHCSFRYCFLIACHIQTTIEFNLLVQIRKKNKRLV